MRVFCVWLMITNSILIQGQAETTVSPGLKSRNIADGQKQLTVNADDTREDRRHKTQLWRARNLIQKHMLSLDGTDSPRPKLQRRSGRGSPRRGGPSSPPSNEPAAESASPSRRVRTSGTSAGLARVPLTLPRSPGSRNLRVRRGGVSKPKASRPTGQTGLASSMQDLQISQSRRRTAFGRLDLSAPLPPVSALQRMDISSGLRGMDFPSSSRRLRQTSSPTSLQAPGNLQSASRPGSPQRMEFPSNPSSRANSPPRQRRRLASVASPPRSAFQPLPPPIMANQDIHMLSPLQSASSTSMTSSGQSRRQSRSQSQSQSQSQSRSYSYSYSGASDSHSSEFSPPGGSPASSSQRRGAAAGAEGTSAPAGATGATGSQTRRDRRRGPPPMDSVTGYHFRRTGPRPVPANNPIGGFEGPSLPRGISPGTLNVVMGKPMGRSPTSGDLMKLRDEVESSSTSDSSRRSGRSGTPSEEASLT